MKDPPALPRPAADRSKRSGSTPPRAASGCAASRWPPAPAGPGVPAASAVMSKPSIGQAVPSHACRMPASTSARKVPARRTELFGHQRHEHGADLPGRPMPVLAMPLEIVAVAGHARSRRGKPPRSGRSRYRPAGGCRGAAGPRRRPPTPGSRRRPPPDRSAPLSTSSGSPSQSRSLTSTRMPRGRQAGGSVRNDSGGLSARVEAPGPARAVGCSPPLTTGWQPWPGEIRAVRMPGVGGRRAKRRGQGHAGAELLRAVQGHRPRAVDHDVQVRANLLAVELDDHLVAAGVGAQSRRRRSSPG